MYLERYGKQETARGAQSSKGKLGLGEGNKLAVTMDYPRSEDIRVAVARGPGPV